MVDYTNEVVGERRSRVIMAIDYYAVDFDLARDAIPLARNMAELYLTSGRLVDLLGSINVMRHEYGLEKLKSGSIKHTTTIAEAIVLLDPKA
ncbi:MAG: hypothetical protein QM681_14100 [Novosphingobium sp.]